MNLINQTQWKIIKGDFDYYKITFPTTTTKTTTYLTTKGETKEKELLHPTSNNPELSAEQAAKVLGLSKDGVRYYLKNLKKKGLIKRKGHDKGGSREIIRRAN